LFGQVGGRDLYVAKCSACHAPDGSGNNTIGRSLSLSDIRPAINRMTDQQLRQVILEGKARMPPSKKFDDQKVRKLTVFLRDLAAGNPDAGKAVAEAQEQLLPHVDQVFRDKCSACHAQDGSGRTTIGKSLEIPDLTSTAVQNQSTEELAEVITKGRGKMPGYAKTFNRVQIGQFVSHIRALTNRGGPRESAENAEPPASVLQPPPPQSTAAIAQPDSQSQTPTPGVNTAQMISATQPGKKTSENLFKAKCASCHGPDGAGKTAMGTMLKIRDVRSEDVQRQTNADLNRVIAKGKNKMPAFDGKLKKEQIEQLVAYIRQLGKK